MATENPQSYAVTLFINELLRLTILNADSTVPRRATRGRLHLELYIQESPRLSEVSGDFKATIVLTTARISVPHSEGFPQ